MNSSKVHQVALPVIGLRSGDRGARIARALCALNGVRIVTVTHASSEVLVEAAAPATLRQMVSAIEGAGCKVATVETTLHIAGMSCIGCASPVEKALTALHGVVQAMASYSARRVQVLSIAPMARQTLVEAVERAGFAVWRAA